MSQRKIMSRTSNSITSPYANHEPRLLFSKAHQLFASESEQEVLEYLEDRNLDHAQLHFLLRHGRKGKAAELQLSEGRVIEAVDLFLEDDEDTSMSRAKETILQNLWYLTPFGVTLIKRDK